MFLNHVEVLTGEDSGMVWGVWGRLTEGEPLCSSCRYEENCSWGMSRHYN